MYGRRETEKDRERERKRRVKIKKGGRGERRHDNEPYL